PVAMQSEPSFQPRRLGPGGLAVVPRPGGARCHSSYHRPVGGTGPGMAIRRPALGSAPLWRRTRRCRLAESRLSLRRWARIAEHADRSQLARRSRPVLGIPALRWPGAAVRPDPARPAVRTADQRRALARQGLVDPAAAEPDAQRLHPGPQRLPAQAADGAHHLPLLRTMAR